ncbi:MAG: hypothetical protein Q4C63_03095 [Eubacteriales bacterium]|nr:hypothetical protein [Eubacteriales bacterium]
MEVVYLGIISKIFNAIFNAILSPVFKFLASLLETVLSWLFDAVLKPLLINVLQPLFTALLQLVVDILAGIIYSLYADCLSFVDALQKAFNIFAGIDKVSYAGSSAQYSLLELIFRLPAIQRAILVLIAIAVVLLLLFGILGTVRSMAELDGEQQRPLSRVLSGVMKGLFKMFAIPMVCLFAIMMSSVILTQTSKALGGSESSLARTVFVVSSLDASNVASYNISGKVKGSGNAEKVVDNIGIEDEIRKDYYNGTKDYASKSTVEKNFYLGQFDYLIGFGAAIFLIFMLAICLLTFITRIFEVIILFMVAPFFAAVQPLDDGERFKTWQDMFVAKLFSGYGAVVAMQVYMLLCPAVMNGRITFGEGSAEANYLLRLIFILGGAWAVVKAGPAITQLLNYQAGASETEHSAAVMAAGAMTGAAIGAGAMAIGSSVSQKYQGMKAKKQEALQASDQSIANRMKKQEKMPGSGGPGTPKPGSAIGNTGPKPKPPISPKIAEKAKQLERQGLHGSSTGTPKASKPDSKAAGGRVLKTPAQGKRTASYLGGRFSMGTLPNGKETAGFHFGNVFRSGVDEDGKIRTKIFGFGSRESADGKTDKIYTPVGSLKRDADGKLHISKVRLGKGVQFKRAEHVVKDADGREQRVFGDMYTKDFSPAGYHSRMDERTGKVEVTSSYKFMKGVHHYDYNENTGSYELTHKENFGVRTEYEKQKDGSYETVRKVGNLTHAEYTKDQGGDRITNHIGYGQEIRRDKKAEKRGKRGDK